MWEGAEVRVGVGPSAVEGAQVDGPPVGVGRGPVVAVGVGAVIVPVSTTAGDRAVPVAEVVADSSPGDGAARVAATLTGGAVPYISVRAS